MGLTTIEVKEFRHGHKRERYAQLRREASDNPALFKEGREKGWMKNDCSQPGRGVRARQQGYNILGRLLKDRQSEASRPEGVQPTTSWCVMKVRRGQEATRFVRVATKRLKNETRRGPPSRYEPCVSRTWCPEPSRSLGTRITRPDEQLRGPRVVLGGCCRCDFATNRT